MKRRHSTTNMSVHRAWRKYAQSHTIMRANATTAQIWKVRAWNSSTLWKQSAVDSMLRFSTKVLGAFCACTRRCWTTLNKSKHFDAQDIILFYIESFSKIKCGGIRPVDQLVVCTLGRILNIFPCSAHHGPNRTGPDRHPGFLWRFFADRLMWWTYTWMVVLRTSI